MDKIDIHLLEDSRTNFKSLDCEPGRGDVCFEREVV